MIRLASKTPIYCSACFNQQPELRHVDCDAACDRGYGYDINIATAHGDGGRVASDDLVLCENCVKEAGEVVGMTDDATLKAENERLQRERDEARRDARKQQEYADRLEGLFDARPEPIKVDHRRKPRAAA